MKQNFSFSNSSIPVSKQCKILLEEFESYPDCKSKWKMLKNVSDQNIELAKKFVQSIQFETLTLELDECPSLDDIFQFLEIIYNLDRNLCSNLMEYIFVLDKEESSVNPNSLKESCLQYLKSTIKEKDFSSAIEKLNLEPDERKIALILTDIAIINEEIAKRLLWELFSKFKDSQPKHFVDSLKILKWASEDLFLVISIIGTEKLLQSKNLSEFNKLLTMFIQEDPDLIYPLIIEVPDSKIAITNLISQSVLEEILEFFNLMESLSPDYLDLLINFHYEKNTILARFAKGSLQTKLSFLQLINEFEESFLYIFFIKENELLLKSLLIEIRDNFEINCFYLGLTLFNDIDKELAQELLLNIDPELVADQLLKLEDELLVINIFITITSINNLYLFYTLQAEFNTFINWLERFIVKVTDLETLALFLVSFQRIFNDTPELPVILTTVVKKLQREESLDDLGVFLGIIGNSENDLLQLILNHLLPNIKLYSTDKIGHLIMSTALYNLETGIGLAKYLAGRLSTEYDIKLLRKAIESIILANAKVAETLLKDKTFDRFTLKTNIIKSDLLDQVLFLETIYPVGEEIIKEINKDYQFVLQFLDKCLKLSSTDLIKVISNSNWLDEYLRDELARIISEKKYDLASFYNLIHTSSWSNRALCKKIIYWIDITELGETLENLERNNPIINKIITLLSEIDSMKAEKLIFDYLQDKEQNLDI